MQLARLAVAAGQVGRHRLEDDVVDALRDGRVAQPRRGDQVGAEEAIDFTRRRRVVGQLAGQELVHRHAQRVDVGGEDGLAVELLRRHVGRAADDGRAVRGDFEEARGAEVGDLGHAGVRDEHVGRPQIAVQHALAVRVVDGVADLAGVVERAGEVERALAQHDRLERLARHVLHHDEEHAVLLLGGGDGDDVRVRDAGEQARLAQQVAEVEVLPVRHLDRDLFVDPGVAREVYGAESAAAERGQDFVLAEDLSLEQHPRGSIPLSECRCRASIARRSTRSAGGDRSPSTDAEARHARRASSGCAPGDRAELFDGAGVTEVVAEVVGRLGQELVLRVLEARTAATELPISDRRRARRC